MQTKTKLKWNYDQMTNQRQDFYDQDTIQHIYLDKLGMKYPQDEDPCLQEQYRQREKTTKNGQITKRIEIPGKKCTRE